MLTSRRGLLAPMLASVLVACADNGGAGADASTTAAPPCQPPADVPPSEYVFVIDQFVVDGSSILTPHAGLNLDGLCSDGDHPSLCDALDFGSSLDPDQNCPTGSLNADGSSSQPGCVFGTANCTGGVDNQFPDLCNSAELAVGIDYRSRFTRAVAQSRQVLLIRVTGVDDTANDCAVRVFFYVGYPTFSTGCDAVLPGRTYAVASSSLMPGATSLDDALAVVNGSIVQGRLRVDSTSNARLSIPLDISDTPSEIAIDRLQIRAELTPSALSNGSLAGAMDAHDWLDAWTRNGGADVGPLEDIIEGLVDLPTISGGEPQCVDHSTNPPTLGEISMGVSIHAVAATISTATPIASAPMPGACGTSVPQADAGSDG